MGKCYLITGSSGYLGKRIVTVLCQNNIDQVSRLKLVDKNIPDDVKEKQEKLCHDAEISAEWIIADITSKESMQKAVQGVDVVIHTAALVDILNHEPEAVMRNVILQGTINMLEASCSSNVQYFIYTSSSAAVGPNNHGDPLIMGDEDTPYLFKSTMIYAKYKHKAEQQVLAANGRKMENGKKFVTCSLRPSLIYGGDNFVAEAMLRSSGRKKVLYSLSPRTALQTPIYVDNLAWSHVIAAKKIQTNGSLIGGNAYFQGDDTPHMSMARFMLLLLEPYGYTISREPVLPFWIAYTLAMVMVLASQFLALFNIDKKISDFIRKAMSWRHLNLNFLHRLSAASHSYADHRVLHKLHFHSQEIRKAVRLQASLHLGRKYGKKQKRS